MKLNVLAASVAAATSLMFAGAAQAAALVLDDWEIDSGSGSLVERTTVGVDGPTPRTATGGVSFTRGDIFVELTEAGSNAQIQLGDCDTCKKGTFSNATGSFGYGYWSWMGGGDLSSYSSVAFDYDADNPGGDLLVAFYDAGGLVNSVFESDIPDSTGTISLAMPDLTGIDITEVRVYAFSEGGIVNALGFGNYNAGDRADRLDLLIDQVAFETPEPSSLALVGLTLAGLGFMRRRRA